jgi:hypothetical protein
MLKSREDCVRYSSHEHLCPLLAVPRRLVSDASHHEGTGVNVNFTVLFLPIGADLL